MKKFCLSLLLIVSAFISQASFADQAPLKLDWDFQLDKDKQQETFKINIDSTDYIQSEANNASALIFKDGKVLAKIPFRLGLLIDEPIAPEFSILSPEGFSPEVKILQVNFQPEACGVVGGKYMFLWDGKKLYNGPVTMKVGEAGVFNVSSEVYFPDDRLFGEENSIVILTVHREWDDSLDNYRIETLNIEKYIWDGKEVKKLSSRDYKYSESKEEE